MIPRVVIKRIGFSYDDRQRGPKSGSVSKEHQSSPRVNHSCLVHSCNEPSGWLFPFPQDVKLKEEWLSKILNPSCSTAVAVDDGWICSKHFVEQDFSCSTGMDDLKTLNPNAVPSVFPWSKPSDNHSTCSQHHTSQVSTHQPSSGINEGESSMIVQEAEKGPDQENCTSMDNLPPDLARKSLRTDKKTPARFMKDEDDGDHEDKDTPSIVDKPYSCSSCGFRTNIPKSLKRHARNHLVKSTFQCGFCSFSVRTAGHLTLHLKLNHRRDSTDTSSCGSKTNKEIPTDDNLMPSSLPVAGDYTQLVVNAAELEKEAETCRKELARLKSAIQEGFRPKNIEKLQAKEQAFEENLRMIASTMAGLNSRKDDLARHLSALLESGDDSADTARNLQSVRSQEGNIMERLHRGEELQILITSRLNDIRKELVLQDHQQLKKSRTPEQRDRILAYRMAEERLARITYQLGLLKARQNEEAWLQKLDRDFV